MQGALLANNMEEELLFCDLDKLGQCTSYVRRKTSLYHTQWMRYSESSCSVFTDVLGLFVYTVTLRSLWYDIDFDRAAYGRYKLCFDRSISCSGLTRIYLNFYFIPVPVVKQKLSASRPVAVVCCTNTYISIEFVCFAMNSAESEFESSENLSRPSSLSSEYCSDVLAALKPFFLFRIHSA